MQALTWGLVQLQGQSAPLMPVRLWALAQIGCGFPQAKGGDVQFFTVPGA
ncbi:MAG: hypothetical protein ACRYF9_15290 [Janthinobacterium lividum]